MLVASIDGHGEGPEPNDPLVEVGVFFITRGTRSQLSVGAVAPAFDGVVIQNGTEMLLAARDGFGRTPRAQVDG